MRAYQSCDVTAVQTMLFAQLSAVCITYLGNVFELHEPDTEQLGGKDRHEIFTGET